MSTILDSLYEAYKKIQEEIKPLNDSLQSIGELIVKHGGEIPGKVTMPKRYTFDNNGVSTFTYSTGASWKQKIMFALKDLNKPVTAKEIAEWINEKEPSLTIEKAASMVTQYASKMAIDKEISVDNSQFRNLYYINE